MSTSVVAETNVFKKQKQNSHNSLANDASTWVVDVKYIQQVMSALERVKFDFEDGIILKHQVLR